MKQPKDYPVFWTRRKGYALVVIAGCVFWAAVVLYFTP